MTQARVGDQREVETAALQMFGHIRSEMAAGSKLKSDSGRLDSHACATVSLGKN
jgi:hypothetical protein